MAEVAILLNDNTDIVNTWCYHFQTCLSKTANQGKGTLLVFTISGTSVFDYIIMYWDKDPDIESIKYGLNANNHKYRVE